MAVRLQEWIGPTRVSASFPMPTEVEGRGPSGDPGAAMAALVRDGGRVATTLGAADVDALAVRNVRATNVMRAPTPEKLALLADQAGSGAIRIEIQQMFSLAEAAAALAAFSAGTIGKIVLIVEAAEAE